MYRHAFTLLFAIVLVVLLECNFAFAQTVKIAEKELAVRQMAAQMRAALPNRCNDLVGCSSDCSLPGCGNNFSTFECTSSFGTDSQCGADTSLLRSLNTSIIRVPNSADFNNADLSAFICNSKRIDTTFKDNQATGSLSAWQYVASPEGGIRIYPGFSQDRDDGVCANYDPRLRDWYIGATSGPKDIVIVVDTWPTMDQNFDSADASVNKLKVAKDTVKNIMSKMTPNDYIGLITTQKGNVGSGKLVQADNIGLNTTLKGVLDGITTSASTAEEDPAAAMGTAFDMLQNAEIDTVTFPNCKRMVIFVTDGFAYISNSARAAAVVQAAQTKRAALKTAKGLDAPVMTLSVHRPGSNTDQSVFQTPRDVACATEGIWSNIARPDDTLSQLKNLFNYMAASAINTSTAAPVRWTNVYEDAFGMGQMVTAALPVYDTSGAPRIIGIAATDILVSEFGGSVPDLVVELAKGSSSCADYSLTECQLQSLRSDSGYVCPAPARTIAACVASGELQAPQTCTLAAQDLNSFLCEPIAPSNLTSTTETPKTSLEAKCCTYTPAGSSSTGSSESGGGAVVIIAMVCSIIGVLLIVAIVVGLMMKSKSSSSAPPATASVPPAAADETSSAKPERRSSAASDGATGQEARVVEVAKHPSVFDNNNPDASAEPQEPEPAELAPGLLQAQGSGSDLASRKALSISIMDIKSGQVSMSDPPNAAQAHIDHLAAQARDSGVFMSANGYNARTRTVTIDDANDSGTRRQSGGTGSGSLSASTSGQMLQAQQSGASMSELNTSTSSRNARNRAGSQRRLIREVNGEKKPIKFIRGKLLGQGGFGRVYQGMDDETGALLAAKEISFEGVAEAKVVKQLAELQREINVMKKFDHPNVVKYFGGDRDGHDFYILMEYVPGGSIRDMIDSFGKLSLNTTRDYTTQLLAGLAHVHEKGVIHRDIKGANTLIDKDGTVKIIDFGTSRSFNTVTGTSGTPCWMAPEVIRAEPVSAASDVWSVGCTVMEMITGEFPWSNVGGGAGGAILYHVAGEQPLQLPPITNSVLRDFLHKTLVRDPSKRPSALQLLDHPFCNMEIELQDDDSANPMIPPMEDPLGSRQQTTDSMAGGIPHMASMETNAPAQSTQNSYHASVQSLAGLSQDNSKGQST